MRIPAFTLLALTAACASASSGTRAAQSSHAAQVPKCAGQPVAVVHNSGDSPVNVWAWQGRAKTKLGVVARDDRFGLPSTATSVFTEGGSAPAVDLKVVCEP